MTDSNRNTDSEKTETIPIYIWSSRDLDKKKLIATETETDTGIFEASVSFGMTDDITSQQIQAFEGDTLYTQYYNFVSPTPFSTSREYNTDMDTTIMGWAHPDSVWGDNWANIVVQNNVKFIYDPCMVEFMDKIGENDPGFDLLDIQYPTPLKQMKSGLYPFEIKCKDHLLLIFRHSDSSPVCASPEHAIKLTSKAGWTNNFNPLVHPMADSPTLEYREKFCESHNGTWSEQFNNCVGGLLNVPCDNIDRSELSPPDIFIGVYGETTCSSHELFCRSMGGHSECMSYEQLGHGRDVCSSICEFDDK